MLCSNYLNPSIHFKRSTLWIFRELLTDGMILVIHIMNHCALRDNESSWPASLHRHTFLFSGMKSTTTENMSMSSYVPALVLRGSGAVAKVRLAARATVVLSRAAVTGELISAG